MALLIVDIGTSGTKAVLFSENGNIIALSYQDYPLIYPKPGWVEIDAETIWEAFRKTVCEVANKHQKEIKALCISCMGNSIVPVRKDGKAIRNSIMAFDTRNIEEVDMIRHAIGEKAYFQIRGGQSGPWIGESKILWLKRNEPETFSQTWKFMTFADFIQTRLGFPAVIDYSTAATSLPYDIKKLEYSEPLMREFGLNRQMFSEPVPSGIVLGEIGLEVRTELCLPKGVKVVSGGHDAPCGLLGAGVTKATPEVLADISGTFESVGCIRAKPDLTQQAFNAGVASRCNITRGTYVLMASSPTSGSIIRWFRDEFAHEERMTAEEEKANAYNIMFAPLKFDGGTVMVIPYFSGKAGDPYAKGAFMGLTLSTSRQQMLQGIVEGVTYEMKALAGQLEAISEVPIEVIRSFGGPTKSSKWLQLKADISGKKVEALHVEEASALGAAILAGVATGVYDSYEQAIKATVKIKVTYQPRPEIRQIYEHHYAIYKQLVEALKPLNKRLYYI